MSERMDAIPQPAVPRRDAATIEGLKVQLAYATETGRTAMAQAVREELEICGVLPVEAPEAQPPGIEHAVAPKPRRSRKPTPAD